LSSRRNRDGVLHSYVASLISSTQQIIPLSSRTHTLNVLLMLNLTHNCTRYG